jgi:hypothetical protein
LFSRLKSGWPPKFAAVTFIFVFFTWLPAWLILGYWFVLQFLTGAATSMAAGQGSSGGIAVWRTWDASSPGWP